MPAGPSLRAKKPTRPAVDSRDEPSAEWGWHGGFRWGTQIMGWFIAIACFCMFIGNQVGHVEDIFLGIVGVITIILLLLDIRRRRTAWRR